MRSRSTQDPANWDDQDLFDQLVSWQEQGKFAQLHPSRNGTWILLIETDVWHNSNITERSDHMAMRFVTDPQDSPQNAIRAALKHLR